MATFLIHTSEEDSTLAVARVVAEFLNEGKEKTALAETPGSLFLTSCSGLLAESRFAELLELFLGHAGAIFSNATGKDLECCLLVICNLVPKLPVEQQVAAVARISASLVAASEKDRNACLLALVELYNVAFDKAARFKVLIQILRYAREWQLQSQITPVVKGKAADWVKDWGLGKEDARSLYLEVSALLKSRKAKGGAQESFDLRIKCLAMYEGAPASELAAVRAVAAETAADFVQSPDMFKCDLLEMAAFKQLESDTEHVAVHQLLRKMVDGDIKGLESFCKQHGSALADCNTTMEEAMVKTRLMALLALGSTGSVSTVSFDQIRESLKIGEDEVEQWIIMAIGKKLVEAKINQLERNVQITRCTQRTFGPAQWTQLRGQLSAWKANLAGVKDLMASAQGKLAMGMKA